MRTFASCELHVLLIAVALAPTVGCSASSPTAFPTAVYVCSQDFMTIDVLEGQTLDREASISVGSSYMPHNITADPEGKELWVTAAYAFPNDGLPDQLLVLDPFRNEVVSRIDLDIAPFVAHVVITPDNRVAYATAMEANLVYKVDARARTRLGTIELPALRRPHGMGLTKDGALLYTANMTGSIGEIDTGTSRYVADYPTSGPAIQIAVGQRFVYASISTPAAIARLDIATKTMIEWPLPNGSRALAQVLLSPDERRLYAAEQGDRALVGSHVFVIDAESGALASTHLVDQGAHGLAQSSDGHIVYVASSYSNSVISLDVEGGRTLTSGKTGRNPAGIVTWSRPR